MWLKINYALNLVANPFYDQKYLTAKVREFDDVIKTNFLGSDTPKENMHFTCVACITIDSVMRIDKKKHVQVYLEECKCKVKKIQMYRFISAKLEIRVRLDSETESKSDTELMKKLEFNSDFLIPNKSFYS